MRTTTQEFIGWLAHSPFNKVEVLYDPISDTRAREIKELAKLIRRGSFVREIIDEDAARHAWSNVVSDRKLLAMAAPPSYDEDDGSALAIATRLVDERRSRNGDS